MKIDTDFAYSYHSKLFTSYTAEGLEEEINKFLKETYDKNYQRMIITKRIIKIVSTNNLRMGTISMFISYVITKPDDFNMLEQVKLFSYFHRDGQEQKIMKKVNALAGTNPKNEHIAIRDTLFDSCYTDMSIKSIIAVFYTDTSVLNRNL